MDHRGPTPNIPHVTHTLEERIGLTLCGMDVELSAHTTSRQQMTAVKLNNVTVVRYEAEGLHRGFRSWSHVHSDSVDCYVVQLPETASFVIANGDAEVAVLPGSFAVLPTARPFRVVESSIDSSSELFTSTHVRIPGPLLRSRVPQIDNISNVPFEIKRGASRIMQRLVECSVFDGAALSPVHANSFGNELLESVARAAEWALEISGYSACIRVKSLSHIYKRATAFIQDNLSSQALDTRLVAEHCKVSLRYLHAAFEETGETVAASIREGRLRGCREVLRNPASRHRSILQIATDWGFGDAAYFSHVYKARFGVCPKDDRKRVIATLSDQQGA